MKFLSWLKSEKKKNTPNRMIPRLMSYQCATVQGIGTRLQQEDAIALVNATDVTQIRRYGLLALLADGMGGTENGKTASMEGIQSVISSFQGFQNQLSLEKQLEDSIIRADEAVHELLQGTGGSTILSCLIYDEKLHYAGVGDSYLYLMRQGKLLRINREQNIQSMEYLRQISQGNVVHLDTESIPEAHAVTQFLGIGGLDDVDCLRQALPLADGDVLLLCSDGIGGVLSRMEIMECLQQPSANDSATELQQKVQEKNLCYQDNYTAVIIHCKK